MIPAARKIPDQPNCPNSPVLGGMKGCQFAAVRLGCFMRKLMPIATKIISTQTFTITIPELKFADSLMPMIKITVARRMARKPKRLNVPKVCGRVDGSIPADFNLGIKDFTGSQWLL